MPWRSTDARERIVMTERVQITISGIRYGDGQREDVEMTARGEYFEKGGTHYIRYDEGEGADVIRNLLKLRPDRMELVKKGAVNAHMIFWQGKKTATSYVTSAGRLDMEIQTRRLAVFRREKEVEAETEYTLAISGQYVSDNRIAVRVAPAE